MAAEEYYLDDELRVQVGKDGSRQATISKKFLGTSDVVVDQAKAIEDFKAKTEGLLDEFDTETVMQEEEIDKAIKHLDSFLNIKFKHHQWGFNREFDMLRLKYISMMDSLMKEKRTLRRDKIMKRLSFEEKLLDAKKELSPFRRLFD